MKAKLENPIVKEINHAPGVRGRKPAEIVFPKRQTGFTIEEAMEFKGNKKNVTEQTVRTRLNQMSQEGRAKVRQIPAGRGHPIYVYTLVA